MTMCEFLIDNCFAPLICKPVNLEYNEDSAEYLQLQLSFSLKDLGSSLRPSYKTVFENIRLLLHCLSNINLAVTSEHHVFSIIGDHIRDRLLKMLVKECLMHAIPETMDELKESTLIEDVLQFEQLLTDNYLFNIDKHKKLADLIFCFKIVSAINCWKLTEILCKKICRI